MPEHQTTYFCTSCGAGHDDPRKITVCSSCGAVESIVVRPVLTATAGLLSKLRAAVDEDDFENFRTTRQELQEMSGKLKPPNVC